MIKRLAVDLGADLFGVAPTEKLMEYIDDEIKQSATKLPYTISIAIRLQKAVLDSLVDRPNQIYKTHYRQVNAALDHATHELARAIQKAGYNAMPILASFIVDWKKQTAHVSHRHVALQAGLGHWGRNNLLIHPQYGAGIRLASLLTDMPLTVDSPISDSCGECVACMAACPADAIDVDKFEFDKCYAKIREFAKTNNYNLLICGLCVKACIDVHS